MVVGFKADCLTRDLGLGGMPSVGVFLRDPSPYLREFRRKPPLLWDEHTMIRHHALSSVDRLLKDLMGLDLPFGGKVFVQCGNWRLVLTDAMNANRTTIIETCLKNSRL